MYIVLCEIVHHHEKFWKKHGAQANNDIVCTGNHKCQVSTTGVYNRNPYHLFIILSHLHKKLRISSKNFIIIHFSFWKFIPINRNWISVGRTLFLIEHLVFLIKGIRNTKIAKFSKNILLHTSLFSFFPLKMKFKSCFFVD